MQGFCRQTVLLARQTPSGLRSQVTDGMHTQVLVCLNADDRGSSFSIGRCTGDWPSDGRGTREVCHLAELNSARKEF
jgi:hypothetical protein